MRPSTLRLSVLALTGLVSCLPVAAQQLISAKAGLIHYTEGDVKIGGQSAGPNNAVFQSLSNGKELTTGEGRAEMLLGPGQFVRLNENSAVLMVSSKLDATRIDVVRGSVLVEIVDIEKNAPITVGVGGNTVELRKVGLYRMDAEQARLRVYDGEAVVAGNGQSVTAKKGKEVSMGAVFAQNGFDASSGDEFSRWAQRRAGYIATANVSGARDVYSSGQNWSSNNWAFNPWYGMYTYVPYRRMAMSPFGFYYFSPDMAFNDMFWPYLGGGYGFYGMGFGSGYGLGFPYYGNGFGYGNGYGGYGTPVVSGGGGNVPKGNNPNRPGYPVANRPDAFGQRGYSNGYSNGGNGSYSGPAMVRGGGAPVHNGDYGGSNRGGGGYSTVGGGGHMGGGGGGHVGGGGGFSGGGGHSSGTVSGGGGSTASAPAATGGGASGGGASAGGRGK